MKYSQVEHQFWSLLQVQNSGVDDCATSRFKNIFQGFLIIIMIKGVPSALLLHNRPVTDRYLHKQKKNAIHKHQNTRADQLHPLHPEIRQKSAQPKKKTHKPKPIKPKKIRFLTEEIEKSTNNWLAIPSNAARKSSSKAFSSEKDRGEDAYELTRTFKKCKRQNNEEKSHRKHSEQIQSLGYDIKNMNKIKLRSPKNHSMSSKKQTFKKIQPTKGSKCGSKVKLLPKTSRNSQATPQQKKAQFLSPEIVKHQSSYCFQSEEEPDNQIERMLQLPREKKCNSLLPPKRQTALLFDSELSTWKKLQPHHLLKSTVDLLN